MKLSVIVLASGSSRRFNGNKLLHEIDKKPMYLHTLDKLLNLKRECRYVDEIIFVTKYDEIISKISDKDVVSVKNNNSEFGISQSIKLGISNAKNDNYMFIVSDQPYIKEETLKAFIEGFFKSTKNLGCVKYGGELLNPSIFNKKYKDELMKLEGDKGGKKIILKNLDDLLSFDVCDKQELVDIDYREQLEDY